jgi:hypothetical protein
MKPGKLSFFFISEPNLNFRSFASLTERFLTDLNKKLIEMAGGAPTETSKLLLKKEKQTPRHLQRNLY